MYLLSLVSYTHKTVQKQDSRSLIFTQNHRNPIDEMDFSNVDWGQDMIEIFIHTQTLYHCLFTKGLDHRVRC